MTKAGKPKRRIPGTSKHAPGFLRRKTCPVAGCVKVPGHMGGHTRKTR